MATESLESESLDSPKQMSICLDAIIGIIVVWAIGAVVGVATYVIRSWIFGSPPGVFGFSSFWMNMLGALLCSLPYAAVFGEVISSWDDFSYESEAGGFGFNLYNLVREDKLSVILFVVAVIHFGFSFYYGFLAGFVVLVGIGIVAGIVWFVRRLFAFLAVIPGKFLVSFVKSFAGDKDESDQDGEQE